MNTTMNNRINTLYLCLLMAFIALVVNEPRFSLLQFIMAATAVDAMGKLGAKDETSWKQALCVGAYVMFGALVNNLLSFFFVIWE